MAQQYVGGLTSDDAAAPTNPRKELGPVAGGIIVIPLLTRFASGIQIPTRVRIPFAQAFVVAQSLHRTGAATTNRNVNSVGGNPVGAEFGASFDLTLACNEPADFTNLNGPTVTFRGNSAVTIRALSSTSSAVAPKDLIEAGPRSPSRGDALNPSLSATPSAFSHSSQMFVAVRGHIYDRDETHQGATIASGVSEPYNSSKD